MDKFFMGLVTALIIAAVLAFGWIITCGIIKLITICFDLVFTWKMATGWWLVLTLIGGFITCSKDD